MTKSVQALADRLVSVVVPRATAKAYSCGEYYLQFCYCLAPNWAFYRPCWWTCWPGDPEGPLCSVGCEVRIRGC